MKCGKCGKEIKVGAVRNKEYGWICVPCSHKLLAKNYIEDDKDARKKEN